MSGRMMLRSRGLHSRVSREVVWPWVSQPALFSARLESLVLIVPGGGVHDKKIRFYNTFHGTLVSSLVVSAQVTTLLWSPSTAEILATFGYTAPGTSTK